MKFGTILSGMAFTAATLTMSTVGASAATSAFDSGLGLCYGGDDTRGAGDDKSASLGMISGATDIYCSSSVSPSYGGGSPVVWSDPFGDAMDYTLALKSDGADGDGYIGVSSFSAGSTTAPLALGTWSVDLLGKTDIHSFVLGIKQGNTYSAFRMASSVLSGEWATWDDIITSLPLTEDDFMSADYVYSHYDLWYKKCESTDTDCGGGGGGLETVPVPAGLPLVLSGLGIFGALRLRKSRKA